MEPEETHSYVPTQEALTNVLLEQPYNIHAYYQRALEYGRLRYPDLCAGDCYKALLLLDAARDKSDEYHEEALASLEVSMQGKGDNLEVEIDSLLSASYMKLISCLIQCGDLRAAYDFCKRGERRFSDRSKGALQEKCEDYEILIENKTKGILGKENVDRPFDFPDRGSVRREIYPWNKHEPDRQGPTYISSLNEQLHGTPCYVDMANLTQVGNSANDAVVQQLGLFAAKDILPGETVLTEVSPLTARLQADSGRCDFCALKLNETLGDGEEEYLCGGCLQALFCSESCRENAGSTYHAAACGCETEYLTQSAPQRETADALMFQLLVRTVAMSETQSKHPLDLQQTHSLWGDFEPSPSSIASTPVKPTLPFSFKYNIHLPLTALEELGINLYTSLARYDFWIFNTLYAKFRGVASAKADSRTGKLEACAVHPLWCLANHSCAPNVKWEMEGPMRLSARTEGEVVRWGGKSHEDGGPRSEGGIRKGEQIWNHYCDVELPVAERRAWMRGSLGGDCMCERCVWEAACEKGEPEGEDGGS